jgi:hypothetical protein
VQTEIERAKKLQNALLKLGSNPKTGGKNDKWKRTKMKIKDGCSWKRLYKRCQKYGIKYLFNGHYDYKVINIKGKELLKD